MTPLLLGGLVAGCGARVGAGTTLPGGMAVNVVSSGLSSVGLSTRGGVATIRVAGQTALVDAQQVKTPDGGRYVVPTGTQQVEIEYAGGGFLVSADGVPLQPARKAAGSNGNGADDGETETGESETTDDEAPLSAES